MVKSFDCWKCGTTARDEPMPLGRETTCNACAKDLHVCRQCTFYDTSKGNSCAEPVADEVRDKERANFCGYFTVNMNAYAGRAQADAALEQLSAMFALGEQAAPANSANGESDALQRERQDEADAAQRALGELFGLDKDK